jgi:hypothetical protein
MRAILIVACLICGALAAYFGQPLVHGNSDAVTVIITVMTVFAGFLVAIMAVIGDPALIPDGSWRMAEHRRENIENRLIGYLWLFVLYLLAIGLLFAGVLLDKAPATVVHEEWKVWIERAYLFFGTTSFLFTFGLPKALWKIQMARIEAEIQRRRKETGLKD